MFREPFDVLDAGRVAAIRDPAGATVSLWQPRSRIGATLLNQVGTLCWNELVTADVDRAKPFFAGLLGWEYETDDSGYTRIRNAGRPNGGMRAPTGHEKGLSPHWLAYFAVESVDIAARRAEQLGGRRLVATKAISSGRSARIADPHGAVFAVFQFPIEAVRPALR